MDTKIALDMFDDVMQYENSPFRHVVVVGSGDADFKPPIDKIMEKVNKFQFEIWSWRQCISSTLTKFAHVCSSVEVKYLDNRSLTFKELKFKESFNILYKVTLTIKQIQSLQKLNEEIESTTCWPAQYRVLEPGSTLHPSSTLQPGDKIEVLGLLDVLETTTTN